VTPQKPKSKPTRLRELTDEYRAIAARLEQGGGDKRIARMHKRGQLAPRERLQLLLDPDTVWVEIGLLVAYDQYDGQAPGAGVITGVGMVEGREVVVIVNDATVKAGAWWPETIKKMLRAQEVAMRQRIPIIYLVDSAGVNLPYQGGVFPGQYGAARLFYYNSIMRHFLHVPQIAAVMGSCIAGGAYLPALSDVIFMVEGTSFMGLGGPNLVKGATGQTIDAESLGGAATHTQISAVAHYQTANDKECLARVREYVSRLPRHEGVRHGLKESAAPARDPLPLYDLLPKDHRMSYDMRQVLDCILDGGVLAEFQPEVAKEMICGHGHIEGRPVQLGQRVRAHQGHATAYRSGAAFRPQRRGRVGAGCKQGGAGAETRDLDHEVPGKGRAHHIPVADRYADEREGSGRAARGEGVLRPGSREGALDLRWLTDFWQEVMKNVG